MNNRNRNRKDKKCQKWSKPTINKISVSLTKGGNIAKNNESLTADHYNSTFGGVES